MARGAARRPARRATILARAVPALCLLWLTASAAWAKRTQQVVDTAFVPRLERNTYPAGTGPRVAIDTGHHNGPGYTTTLRPLRTLLTADGYRVRPLADAEAPDALRDVDILVIVDALADRNVDDWTLPTPSAFDAVSRAAIVSWVRAGGALLLAADHMPFAGAAAALGCDLGLELLNGFAIDTVSWDPITFRTADGTLQPHAILRGRTPAERVDSVFTYWSQAFRALHDSAAALLVFPPGIVSFQPDTAWRFRPRTPVVAVGGWAAGMALRVGRGRVVVLGDTGMFMAHLVGPRRLPVGLNAPAAAQNQQFMMNVIHWLSGLLPE